MLTSPLCVLALAITSALPVGTELQYSGTLRRAEGADGAAEKTFTLSVLQMAANQAVFLVEERGAGGWEWPQRFGQLAAGSSGIRLLYILNEMPTPLPVRSPLFEFTDRVAPEAEWMDGTSRYTCLRVRTLNGREVADIEASLDRGRQQRMQVEMGSGILLQLEERLFLGRGEPFLLNLKLEDQRALAEPAQKATTRIVETLTALQSQLPPPDALSRPVWSTDDLKMAQDSLATLKTSTGDFTWGKFVTAIQRDLAVQQRRLEGVAGLEKKYRGQPAPAADDLKSLVGPALAKEGWTGRVTVLHFWPYDGDHLVEPYGQVGYLDFLYQRRGKLGVQVVGIAVDPQFSDPAKQKNAARRVRKFQEFMNLSYSIATDDGSLLTKFGDPRAINSDLPLWVVVGADGRIQHYKAGHYTLQPDEGLRELDAAVVAALKQQRNAAKQP